MSHESEKKAGNDSVPLDAPDSTGDSGDTSDKLWRSRAKRPRIRSANLKIVISLFLIFVLVVSDVFTGSIIGGFSGATRCRSPTSWGIVLQGIFLVIFFILAVHMIDANII